MGITDRSTVTARCPACGYSLAGSLAQRCPECGTIVDEDAVTAALEEVRPRRLSAKERAVQGIATVVCFAVVVMMSVMIALHWDEPTWTLGRYGRGRPVPGWLGAGLGVVVASVTAWRGWMCGVRAWRGVQTGRRRKF